MRYLLLFAILLVSCGTPKHVKKHINNNDSIRVERAIDRTLEKYFEGHLTSK
jgi:hypothetical protein